METLNKIKELVFDWKRESMTKGETLANVIEDAFNGEMGEKDKRSLCLYLTTRMHRYLQKELFKFVMRYIKTYAELPDRCFDPRNKYVQDVSKAIVENTTIDGYKIFNWETAYTDEAV